MNDYISSKPVPLPEPCTYELVNHFSGKSNLRFFEINSQSKGVEQGESAIWSVRLPVLLLHGVEWRQRIPAVLHVLLRMADHVSR